MGGCHPPPPLPPIKWMFWLCLALKLRRDFCWKSGEVSGKVWCSTLQKLWAAFPQFEFADSGVVLGIGAAVQYVQYPFNANICSKNCSFSIVKLFGWFLMPGPAWSPQNHRLPEDLNPDHLDFEKVSTVLASSPLPPSPLAHSLHHISIGPLSKSLWWQGLCHPNWSMDFTDWIFQWIIDPPSSFPFYSSFHNLTKLT